MGNVSGNINLNALVNATELVNFELYNNSLTGMISTDNSIPLPGNIKSFNMVCCVVYAYIQNVFLII